MSHSRIRTRFPIVALAFSIAALTLAPRTASAAESGIACPRLWDRRAQEATDRGEARARSELSLRYAPDPEQTIHPPRTIEEVFPGAPGEEFLEVAEAKIVMMDTRLLKRDFPQLEGLSDEEIERWLVRHVAGMSRAQVSQHVVNTEIPTTGRVIRGWRPPSYGRAGIFALTDPRDPSKQIGLADANGVGKRDRPSHASHGNGLGPLAEKSKDMLMEHLVRWIEITENSDIKNVGSYAVIDLGFDMIYPDGSRTRAALYVRQAHKRLNYDDGNIRSAWLPAEHKARVLPMFEKYGIETGAEKNIQGIVSPDGEIGLFDWGHYIVSRHATDAERAIPFALWGQPHWARQGDDQWSLSQQDHAWNNSWDTARDYASGKTGRFSFRDNHEAMLGPAVERMEAWKARQLAAIKKDGKAPGSGARPYGRELPDPTDLRYTRLSQAQRAILLRQQLEAQLGRSLNARQAEDFEKAMKSSLGLGAGKGPEREKLRKKLKIVDEALLRAGLVDPRARKEFAAALVRKEPVDGTRLPHGSIRGPPGQAARDQLVEVARRHDLPAFIRTTPNGDLPVVLINQETLPYYAAFLSGSAGDAVKLFPDHSSPTDHGIFRVGDWQIDYYFPYSGYGENMGTGIRWRHLPEYVSVATPESNRIVEVAYQLTPDEKRVADLYHRVRRAAIFRVRHEFQYFNPAYDGTTAILEGGAETCYKFGTGICSQEHAEAMKRSLVGMGVQDPNALLEDARVRAFLEKAERDILSIPVDQPPFPKDAKAQESVLHDWILRTPENIALLRDVMPAGVMQDADQVRFMNFLLGIEVSRKYLALAHELGLFDPTRRNDHWPARRFIDESRPRATAILIWDFRPEAPGMFRAADYSVAGSRYRFSAAPGDGRSRPLPK